MIDEQTELNRIAVQVFSIAEMWEHIYGNTPITNQLFDITCRINDVIDSLKERRDKHIDQILEDSKESSKIAWETGLLIVDLFKNK